MSYFAIFISQNKHLDVYFSVLECIFVYTRYKARLSCAYMRLEVVFCAFESVLAIVRKVYGTNKKSVPKHALFALQLVGILGMHVLKKDASYHARLVVIVVRGVIRAGVAVTVAALDFCASVTHEVAEGH